MIHRRSDTLKTKPPASECVTPFFCWEYETLHFSTIFQMQTFREHLCCRLLSCLSEHDKRTTHGEQCPRNCKRGSRRKGRGPFTSRAVFPWIVLECDFLAPQLNIYIPFIGHVNSWWMSEPI